MNLYIVNFLAIFFFSFILSLLFFKKKLLLNFSGNKHQKFTSYSQVPLIGGLIFFFVIFFIPYFNIVSKLAFLLILLVGLFSDLKYLNSPKTRLFFQFIIVSLFLIIEKINLANTNIFFLDLLLQNYFFSILFTSFCFLININGSNFQPLPIAIPAFDGGELGAQIAQVLTALGGQGTGSGSGCSRE
jgi:hypothetical protein